MNTNINALLVANILIGQDSQGRYCLNDLHRASGDNQKHKPANWLRLDQTKEIIEEINHSSEMMNHFSEMRSAVEVINGGNNRGTFVVKPLVYAYAMWISPKFHLHVIEAYDAMVMGKTVAPLKTTTPMDLPIEAAPNKLALLKEIRSMSRELCYGAKNSLHRKHVGKALCELNELAGFAEELNPLVLLEMEKGVPMEAVDSSAVVQFWDNYRLIIESGIQLNHARNVQHVAINLPYFIQLCHELGLPLADKTTLANDLKVSKRFVGFSVSVMSKITNKTCRCWVFSQQGGLVVGGVQ